MDDDDLDGFLERPIYHTPDPMGFNPTNTRRFWPVQDRDPFLALANCSRCGTPHICVMTDKPDWACPKCIAREEGWNTGPGIDSITEAPND